MQTRGSKCPAAVSIRIPSHRFSFKLQLLPSRSTLLPVSMDSNESRAAFQDCRSARCSSAVIVLTLRGCWVLVMALAAFCNTNSKCFRLSWRTLFCEHFMAWMSGSFHLSSVLKSLGSECVPHYGWHVETAGSCRS